jgi:Iron-containing redox enzyme
MSFAQLKKVFDETQKDLIFSTENFNWTDKPSYANWLSCTFDYAENSTRLLAMAGGMMPKDKTSVSNRFINHAAEEKGHEKLLLNDVKGLGLSFEIVRPTYEMQCYSRSLSYWIAPGGNPVGLIGWVLSLEGVAAAVGPKIFEKVLAKYGAKATSFLKVHAESDPEHLEKALSITKGLSEADTVIVCDALKMYSYQYQRVLESIKLIAEQKSAA